MNLIKLVLVGSWFVAGGAAAHCDWGCNGQIDDPLLGLRCDTCPSADVAQQRSFTGTSYYPAGWGPECRQFSGRVAQAQRTAQYMADRFCAPREAERQSPWEYECRYYRGRSDDQYFHEISAQSLFRCGD